MPSSLATCLQEQRAAYEQATFSTSGALLSPAIMACSGTRSPVATFPLWTLEGTNPPPRIPTLPARVERSCGQLPRLTLHHHAHRALHETMRSGGPKQAELAALTFALLLKTPACSVRVNQHCYSVWLHWQMVFRAMTRCRPVKAASRPRNLLSKFRSDELYQ